MAITSTKIGRVSINPQGEYSNGTQYQRLDVVTLNGSGYICIQDCQGIPVTNTSYWYLLVSKGDTYEVTEEDLQRIASQIEEDASSLFNQLVTQKTNEFNTNATQKTNDFNSNATSKTTSFDNNATDKTTAFNNNATSKTSDFNTNATQKGVSFDANYDDKLGLFNGNATTKTSDFDSNATAKTTAYNDNATSKTEAYDDNAEDKTDDFNDNYDAKLASFNSNAESYANHIQALEDNFDVDTTPNSNNYTTEDSASGYNKGNIKIGDGPELEQITITGKNMFDKDTATYTNNEYLDNNGEVVSSTKSGHLNSYIEVEPNTAYTIQGNIAGTSVIAAIYFYDSSKNWISKLVAGYAEVFPYTFNTPENCKYIQFQYLMSVYNADTVMIEQGSTASDYEPYTGGQYLPSPDYPQDIVVVEGSSNIKLNNQNLFDGNNTPLKSNTLTTTFSNDVLTITNPSSSSNRSVCFIIPIQQNKDITISHGTITILSENSVITKYYRLYKTKPTSIVATEGTEYSDTEVTVNTGTNNYLGVVFRMGNAASATIENVQVEYGSKTAYKSYKGQTYPITLPTGMFLGSIGDASNYIYGTKDNWKLHGGIGKHIFDGTESFSKSSSYAGAFYKRANTFGGATDGLRLYCNFLKNQNNSNNFVIGEVLNGSNYIFWLGNETQYPDATAFKAKLTTLYNNGTPMQLYFVLETPTETDITDTTLITQLNNIADNLQTYKGETIVFTSGESLAPNIQFDYMVNPLASVETQINSMQAQILELAGGE